MLVSVFFTHSAHCFIQVLVYRFMVTVTKKIQNFFRGVDAIIFIEHPYVKIFFRSEMTLGGYFVSSKI